MMNDRAEAEIMTPILFGVVTRGKIDNLLHLSNRFGTNQLCNDDLHYEKTSYSFVFAPDCCVPELLRSRRANDSDDHNNDSRDESAGADIGDADHDHALLDGSFLPTTREGHATACPYFFRLSPASEFLQSELLLPPD